MAKYLKITPIKGNDLYIYDNRYQENTAAYNDLLYTETIDDITIKSVKMDGIHTTLFINDVDFLPSVSTVLIKVKFDTQLYSSSFGLCGFGTNNSLVNSWGCFVENEDIKIQTSNGLNMFVQTFENFKFTSLTIFPNQYHDIAIVSSNDSVKFYLDGVLKDQMELVSPLVSDNVPDKIYFGSLGEINSYSTVIGYIREVAFWKRELNEADIYELYNQYKIEDHPGLITTNKYIHIDSGKLYYNGSIHNIPSVGIYITGSGTENIDLVISEQVFTEENDPELNDTSVGYYNFGKPGAHRIAYSYQIVKNYESTENDTNVVITLLTYINGELVFDLLESQKKKTETDPIPSNTPGEQDLSYLISSKLAEAIKDINGNFIVNGLETEIEDLGNEGFRVSILPGKYYVNGVKKELTNAVNFIIDKNYQTYNIDGEIVRFNGLNTPYILSYQPLAKDINGGRDAIQQFIMPVIKTVNISKAADDNADLIDENGVAKLHSVSSAGVEFFTTDENNCVGLSGNFLSWIPNKPKPTQGTEITIVYTQLVELTENLDYFRAIGNAYTTETITFKGLNVVHTLSHEPKYIIDVSTSGIIKTAATNISGQGIIITDDAGLVTGDNATELNVKYSYSNNAYYNDKTSLFFTDNREFDTSLYGYIDYDYYLNEIYTIGVTPDNEFNLYAGIPGSKESMVKAALSSEVLPISDITINPLDDSYIITKYNWIRNPISNVVSTYNRLDRIENTVLLSELENKALSFSDPQLLKGTFVDPLTDYIKSDIFYPDYSCFIDMVESENGCSSGLDKIYYRIQPENTTGYTKYNEIATIAAPSSEITQNRIKCSSWYSVNASNSQKVLPDVNIINAFDYISEKNTSWLQKMIDNILFNYQSIIPSNINSTYYSSLNISSNYTGDTKADSKNHSSAIQKIVKNMENLLGITTEYYIGEKWLMIIGKGFNNLESNIRIKINQDIITTISSVVPTYLSNIQKYKIDNIFTIGGNKTVYMNPTDLTSFTGWQVANGNIRANQYGEFIIFAKINSPTSYNSVKYTGLYETEILRANSLPPVKIKTNLYGISDRLNGILKSGKRINDSIFNINNYSNSTTPSIAQIFKVTSNITMDRIQLPYNGDISSNLCVEIREVENGIPTNTVLARERVKNTTSKIINIIFSNKILLETNKDYALCLCDNGNSSFGISTIGQPSTLYAALMRNIITGAEAMECKKTKTNLFDASSKLLINNGTIFGSPSYSVVPNSELSFNLYAINTAGMATLSDGSYYSTINYSEITFDSIKYFFNFMCDFNDTFGDFTDVKFTYKYKKNAEDEYSQEYEFNPYSLVNVPNGIKQIKFYAYIKSKNKNISPQVHLFPLLASYSYKQQSYYVSKSFELYDNNADNVKLYFETYIPNECNIETYLSPDDTRTWRQATLVTDLNNLVVGSDGRYVSYAYDYYFRLQAPTIAALTNDDKIALGTLTGTYYYKISSVDSDGAEVGSNLVTASNLSNNQIKLSLTLDPNSYGFKVYRGTNENLLKQIYDSTARTTLLTAITGDVASIDITTASDFPYSGYIRIDNEIILYTSRNGNTLSGISRAQKNSVKLNHLVNADVYMWDYGTINSNKYDGQIPTLSEDFKFNFIDGVKVNNINKYIENSEKVFAGNSNNTNIYPKRIKIKVKFINNIQKAAPFIKKMICNALA